MNSPLGRYGQAVAAAMATFIIVSYVLSLVFTTLLGIPDSSLNALDKLAFFAAGAVFGGAAAINGVKAPIDSAHSRIDKIETATNIRTHGSYQEPSDPGPAHQADESVPVDMAGPPSAP